LARQHDVCFPPQEYICFAVYFVAQTVPVSKVHVGQELINAHHRVRLNWMVGGGNLAEEAEEGGLGSGSEAGLGGEDLSGTAAAARVALWRDDLEQTSSRQYVTFFPNAVFVYAEALDKGWDGNGDF
jgi:hypothetical protein